MQKYYKWLKFNHIEHETKIRFITEIVDDLTADPPREAVVYTPSDVKQRQDAMLALKAQLKQAKTQVRSLRSDIDSLTTQAARPYVTLTTSCNEAKSLLDECMDLELEVAKFTSSSAAPSSSSTSQPSVDHLDLESLPSVGTLTATEADAFCTRQEEALSALEESNTALDAEFTALKHEFKSSVKTVDRLENEVSHVAKQSNAIQGGLGKRDDKVEKVCMSHLATLDVFKSLIGLKKMEARGDTRLRLTYATHVATGEAEYILQLNFDQPGGRLVDVEVRLRDDAGRRFKCADHDRFHLYTPDDPSKSTIASDHQSGYLATIARVCGHSSGHHSQRRSCCHHGRLGLGRGQVERIKRIESCHVVCVSVEYCK